LTDFEDIQGLKNGSEHAFVRLVEEFSVKILNLCFSILQNREDAEDATQEVFSTVFLSVKDFKGDAKLSTWMYRIAVNKCQEHFRKKNRKKRFGFFVSIDNSEQANWSPSFFHPGIELENKERSAILFAAIDRLPENQKLAFTLHKIEGLPHEEVCSVLNLSLSSVESLLFRAKQSLKKNLSEYYEKNEK
jgi:RNA polymerase sigma-70 factor (ECF subfamily)